MSSAKKVMEATARALAEMSADPDFLSGINECCRSIKGMLKRAVARGGGLSTSSLVEKRAGEEVRGERARRGAS